MADLDGVVQAALQLAAARMNDPTHPSFAANIEFREDVLNERITEYTWARYKDSVERERAELTRALAKSQHKLDEDGKDCDCKGEFHVCRPPFAEEV